MKIHRTNASACFALMFAVTFSLVLLCQQLPTRSADKAAPLSTQEILQRLRNLSYPTLGSIYARPTDQDKEGRGIYPQINAPDTRSEQLYLPFVFAPRRQTDSLVRQGYLLLPQEIRFDTAFILADRIAQYPDRYLPYLQNRQKVVIIGNFIGTNRIRDQEEYNSSEYDWLRDYHSLALEQLRNALAVCVSLGKEVVDVVYAMGDSSTTFGDYQRRQLQAQFDDILVQAGKSNLRREIAWGADEAVMKAFARQLGNLKVKVVMANPQAQHYYDANKTTQEIVRATLEELGLTQVEDDTFDFQVHIFNRRDGGSVNSWSADPLQKQFDRSFADQIATIPKNQHTRTVIIDGRIFNGAWDALSIPPSDQFLAYGSWGTFSNVCGQTLALAKLLYFAKQPKIQRQLLLEAVAHDIFANGYEEAQRGQLKALIEQAGIEFKHYQGYEIEAVTKQVFAIVNDYVNQRMAAMMPDLGSTKFTVVPQLWRTFESQVFASDGFLAVAGVYNTALDAKVFNPFVAAVNVRKFTFDELLRESGRYS